MTHDWLYHEIWNGWQVVSCRRCGKYDKYRLVGYKPEPPTSECSAMVGQSGEAESGSLPQVTGSRPDIQPRRVTLCDRSRVPNSHEVPGA